MNAFDKAAQLLEERGWTNYPDVVGPDGVEVQYNYRSTKEPTCVVIAVDQAIDLFHDDMDGDAYQEFLESVVREVSGQGSVVNYNDHRIADQAAAIAFLRHVSKKWEER